MFSLTIRNKSTIVQFQFHFRWNKTYRVPVIQNRENELIERTIVHSICDRIKATGHGNADNKHLTRWCNLCPTDVCATNVCPTDVCETDVCETDVCRTDVCLINICRTDIFQTNICLTDICPTTFVRLMLVQPTFVHFF